MITFQEQTNFVLNVVSSFMKTKILSQIKTIEKEN